MELIYRKMPRDYTIIDSSCWHSGAANCHKEGILELIDKVKTKKNYFLGFKGDAIECILPDDKRYKSAAVDTSMLTPQKQVEWLKKVCKPIAPKILFWQLGNHEYHVLNTVDIAWDLCRELGIAYGGLMCKFVAVKEHVIGFSEKPVPARIEAISLAQENIAFKWMSMHGSRGLPKGAKDPIQRMGNRKAALKRILEETGHNDCMYMSQGHDHSALFAVAPTINDEVGVIDDGENFKEAKNPTPPQNSQYIPPNARWYGIAGSLRKTLSPPGSGIIDYAELKGYGPSPLGWLEVKVENYNIVDVEAVRL